MNHGYSYQSALASSEVMRWRIEDIIGGERRLDFSKPFMPESFARIEPLAFLTADEKRTLNQIRGNAYLCIFGKKRSTSNSSSVSGRSSRTALAPNVP